MNTLLTEITASFQMLQVETLLGEEERSEGLLCLLTPNSETLKIFPLQGTPAAQTLN